MDRLLVPLLTDEQLSSRHNFSLYFYVSFFTVLFFGWLLS